MTAMRTELLVLTGALLLVGCDAWMGEASDEKAASRQSLSFPAAPETNFLNTAVGAIDVPAARMVDSVSFNAALVAAGKLAQGPRSTFETAISVASLANDPSVTASVFVESTYVQENIAVTGSVWVVPKDTPNLTSSGYVIAQRFTVHHVDLSFTAAWASAANKLSAAVQNIASSGAGSSVCCGPTNRGTLPGPPQPDGMGGNACPTTAIPSAYCTPNVFLGSMENPPNPFAQFRTYRGGYPQTYNMLPPLGGTAGLSVCENIRPICDVDPLTGNEDGTAEATWPRYGTCTGESVEYGGGRLIDESCIFASGWVGGAATSGKTMSYGAGSFSPGVSCDGQCPECSTTTSAFNTGVLPKQCAFSRYEPGSGICDRSKDEAWVAASQQNLNNYILATNGASCGNLSSPLARCSCAAPDGHGRRECVQCTGDQECHHYTRVTDLLKVDPPEAPNESNIQFPATMLISALPGTQQEKKEPVAPAAPPAPAEPTPPAEPAPQTVGDPPEPTKEAPTPQQKEDRAGRIAEHHNDKGPPNAPSANPQNAAQPAVGAAKAGDPVSVLDGAFTLSSVDLSFEGPRRPLEFSRSYSSRSGMRGFLGSNWTHNWDMRVIPLRKENLPGWVDPYCAGTPNQTTCAFLEFQDSVNLYTRDEGSGLFLPQAGSVNTLTANTDGTWSMRGPDGHTWSFDKGGYLTQDRDRFGNGFALTYEDTPWGTLRKAACPEVPFAYSAGAWTSVAMPGTNLDTLSPACALLRGMTGEADLPWWDPSITVTIATFPLAAGAPAAATAARTWAVARQADGFGTGSPFGQNAQRPLTVTDDMGRQLQFHYDSNGLLSSVDGPAGTRVDYRYLNLKLAAPTDKAGLGEFFLQEVERRDGAAPSGLTATAPRGFRFHYAVENSALMPTAAQITDVRQRYLDFYESSLNCGFHTLNPCGQKYSSGYRFARTGPMTDKEAMRIFAESADNITRVDVVSFPGVLVESETHYDTSPFSHNYDRVRAQRWGDATATPAVSAPVDPLGQPWTTEGANLPLATFNYVQAAPDGASEATSGFLETELANLYPLEDLDASASARAESLGLLLLPNSTVGTVIPNRLKPTVVGEYQLLSGGGFAKKCTPEAIPYRRSGLPGYRPSYIYFERALTMAALNSPVEGVDLSASLKRSRLSCDVLATAQSYDVASNDLATMRVRAANQPTGGVPGTTYEVQRVTGRRKYTADNANRICGWTRVVDRDGDTRVFGLNFQGRTLVDAVKMRDGSWRVAENLYNADANLVARRQPLPHTTAWTPSAGDTRYAYQEYRPGNGRYAVGFPLYWSRRFNVVDEVVTPKGGGSLAEETEGVFTPSSSTGRYAHFDYEWFFNQPLVIERGSISGAVRTMTSRVAFTYDYQERPLAQSTSLLDELQSWGAAFPKPSGAWDFASIDAALPTVFPAAFTDFNGDGVYGLMATPPVASPWMVARGLPVQTRLIVPSGSTTKTEATYTRWSPSGLPYWVQTPDGNMVTFRYYPLTTVSGAIGNAGAGLSGGEAGLLGEVWRRPRQWIDAYGPASSTCSTLGPYKYMLTGGCADIPGGLAALKLPQSVIDAITGYLTREESVRFDYNLTGTLLDAQSSGKEKVRTLRDTDGRVLTETVYDVNAALTVARQVTTTYDALLRPTAAVTTDGTSFLTASRWKYDPEGRTIWECTEAVSGACLPLGSSPSLSPTDGAQGSRQLASYYAEGALRSTTDPEGTVTTFVTDGRKWTTLATTASGSENRTVTYVYDDRGNLTSRVRAGSSASGSFTLSQSMTWDGLGRLSSLIDEEGRAWGIKYSRRDVRTSVRRPVAPVWVVLTSYDDFGRRISTSTNGTTTESLSRTPGGEVFAQSAQGSDVRYTTYDHAGRPVWGLDGAGNQWVRTYQWEAGGGALRRETASRIRKNGTVVQTNAFRRDLNVLGDIATEVEYGGGLTRTATFVRDALGRATKTTDVDSSITEATFDGMGMMKSMREQRTFGGSTANDFEASAYTYDRRGNLLSVTDASGWKTTQTYNGFGEPLQRVVPGTTNVTTDWTFDNLGRLKREIIGGTLADVTYNYTGAQLTSWSRGGNTLRSFRYDGLARMDQATNFNFGHASLGGSPWNAAVSGAAANRKVVSDFGYDSLGRLTTQQSKVGARAQRSVTSVWSLVSNKWRRVTTLPGGSTSQVDFDGNGRFATIARITGTTTESTSSFSWLGELPVEWSTTKTGSRLRRQHAYDGLGQLVSQTTTAVDVNSGGNPLAAADGTAVCPGGWVAGCGTPTLKTELRRDVMGRIGSFSLAQRRPTAGSFATETAWRGYGFDAIGRVAVLRESTQLPSLTNLPNHTLTLTQVEAAGNSGVTPAADRWAYTREGLGKVGNLTQISKTNGTAAPRFISPARLAGHQLPNYGVDNATANRTVAHDAAGRMTSDGTQRLKWDDTGALIGVTTSPTLDTLREGLLYDGLSRLVLRADPELTLGDELVWDGQQMVAAYATNTTAALKWTAAWGPGIDRLLSVKAGSTTYLAIEDGKANVVGYYDASTNKLAAWSDFTPEGRARISKPGASDTVAPVVCTESASTRCGLPAVGMPFGLHGAYRAVGTVGTNLTTANSSGLYYFRNRWYSAEAGQFLSQDALGYVDSFNSYMFNGGDAINSRDPSGMGLEQVLVGGGGAGAAGAGAGAASAGAAGAGAAAAGAGAGAAGAGAGAGAVATSSFQGYWVAGAGEGAAARTGGAIATGARLNPAGIIFSILLTPWTLGNDQFNGEFPFNQELPGKGSRLPQALPGSASEPTFTPGLPNQSLPQSMPGTAAPNQSLPGAQPNAPPAVAAAKLNWRNVKSIPTYGHTFLRHGEGKKNTERLRGRAAGTDNDQGQWLDNGAAAAILERIRPTVKDGATIAIPPGLGQVIKPDGTIVPSTEAQVWHSHTGGYTSAYPVAQGRGGVDPSASIGTGKDKPQSGP